MTVIVALPVEATTWLFVTMWPAESTTTPEPSAAEPSEPYTWIETTAWVADSATVVQSIEVPEAWTTSVWVAVKARAYR